MNSAEPVTPLEIRGEIYALLSYRLVPPRSDPADRGKLHLSTDELDAALTALTQPYLRKANATAGAGWIEKHLVTDNLLLPHLSEVFFGPRGDGSPDAARPSTPLHADRALALATCHLTIPNIDWSSLSANLRVGSDTLRLTGAPSLYMFGTGIAYVVLPLSVVEGPNDSVARSVSSERFMQTVRYVGRGYRKPSKGESPPPASDGVSLGLPGDSRSLKWWSKLLAELPPSPTVAPPRDALAPTTPSANPAAPDEPAPRTYDSLWEMAADLFITRRIPPRWRLSPAWTQGRRIDKSDRRRTAPQLVGKLLLSRSPTPTERETLRELLEPGSGLALAAEDHRGTYSPSEREWCVQGPSVLWWLKEHAGDLPLKDFKNDCARFRQSQLFLWILADHQRAALVSLATAVAAVGLSEETVIDDWVLARNLRESLVHYSARFHFVTVCLEDRYERLYEEIAAFARLEHLLLEAQREVTNVHELVAVANAQWRAKQELERDERQRDERERERVSDGRRNIALAAIAFLFSPVGIAVGMFQDKTLPPLEGPLGAWILAATRRPETQITAAFLVAGLLAAWILVPDDLRAMASIVAATLRRARRRRHRPPHAPEAQRPLDDRP